MILAGGTRSYTLTHKTLIIRIKDCSKPSKLYVKNPPVVFLPITHNGTLSGNITFSKDTKNMKGPFKTTIVSVKDCSNPSRPYLKNPPIILSPSVLNIDGKNMLGGNLTVLREIKDVKMKIKCFAWRNGIRRQTHSFNNLNCHSTVLHFTFAATRIKYDKNTCMFMKGFYIFQNMDVNKLQHIWVPNMPYGRLLWRVETLYKDGIIICKEFDTITEPTD